MAERTSYAKVPKTTNWERSHNGCVMREVTLQPEGRAPFTVLEVSVPTGEFIKAASPKTWGAICANLTSIQTLHNAYKADAGKRLDRAKQLEQYSSDLKKLQDVEHILGPELFASKIAELNEAYEVGQAAQV